MDHEEIKGLIEEQGRTFEAFKAANDLMQKQIETLGAADTVTQEQVGKLNKALDDLNAQLSAIAERGDKIELRLNRPGALNGGAADAEDAKALDAFNVEIKANARERGRPVSDEFDLKAFRDYKKKFTEFMRWGDKTWNSEEIKAMSVGGDPEGGYLVPADLGGRIASKIYETSEMRPVASVQPIGSDALEGPNDLTESGAGWVAESGARPATAAPTTGKWRIPVHEVYAMPEMTQQLLDDAAIDVGAWLEGKVGAKLARLENTAFVTGNGVGKPRGFLSHPVAATADSSRAWATMEYVFTGTSAGFGTAPNGSDKLIDLVHTMKAAYRAGARWSMNRATVGEVRKLKDAQGNYLWLPTMVAGQPAQLLGYPVSEFEDMPDIAANSLSIGFGNFAVGYQIVDRQGIRVLRDPFTNKPFVRFYTTRRVGGDVLNFEAIKLLKFGTS